MRDLFQPKAGGGLPVPCGLHVAFGRRARTGPYNAGTLPDGTVCRGRGRSVLPVCCSFGAAGRNRSWNGLCRWNKAGEPRGTVYVLLVKKCGKASENSPAEGSGHDRAEKSAGIESISGRVGGWQFLCARERLSIPPLPDCTEQCRRRHRPQWPPAA